MPMLNVLNITSTLSIDVVRKNIKNIHLAVYPPSGRVRIAVPLSTKDETIRLFAISKLSWIKRQQRQFLAQERLSLREYKQRESHYFLGIRYLLYIVENNDKSGIEITNKKHLTIFTKPNTSSKKLNSMLNDWYRDQLSNMIPPIIEKWENIIQVKANKWSIRQMKTKWGSCNSDNGNILLNLELAKKPIQCLEYIIVHELIHLIERKHNDNFFALLDKHLPQWKTYKNELNRLPISFTF